MEMEIGGAACEKYYAIGVGDNTVTEIMDINSRKPGVEFTVFPGDRFPVRELGFDTVLTDEQNPAIEKSKGELASIAKAIGIMEMKNDQLPNFYNFIS